MACSNLGRAVETAGQDEGEELAELVGAVPAMLWRLGADMRCTFVNAAWLAFTGRSREEELGMGWTEGLHPEDFDSCLDAIATAFDGRHPFATELRLRRHDGCYRWLCMSAAPLWRCGGFAGFAGTGFDIDRRRRLEENQRAAIAELGHSMRNTLASVQALAWQGFRASPDPKRAQEVFLARLGAMANAQDLVTADSWRGTDLAMVVTRMILAHGETGARIAHRGEPVRVTSQRAMGLALSLHELATNAAEHGALSVPEGRVTLRWRAAGGWVEMEWAEAGGPPASPPRRTGFGLRLIRTLGREAGGDVSIEHAPEGFACRLRFPEAERALPQG